MMGKCCVNNNKGWPCVAACTIFADIAFNRTVTVATVCLPFLKEKLLV